MARLSLFTPCLTVFLWAKLALSQGPNTLAPYNPKARTYSINATWFIIPISTTDVQKAVTKYSLGPVPRHDKTLFPNGFPADKHPVLVMIGYENDIRRGNLEIDALMGSNINVPYVDRLGDGTPFTYPISTYIGGANGQDFMGVVPAAVGSINSQPIRVGQFNPNNAAYTRVGADEFTTQVKREVVPNPISGPGVAPAAIDYDFFTARAPAYTPHTFHALINQPQILTRGMGKCQRNTIYFNQTFTRPVLRTGRVVLYAKSVPDSVAGVYTAQTGYSANGVEVGFNPQGCRAAANSVDPKAQM